MEEYIKQLQNRSHYIVSRYATQQDYDLAQEWIANPSLIPCPDAVQFLTSQYGIGRGTVLILCAILQRLTKTPKQK